MMSDRSFFTTLHSGYYHCFLLQTDMLYGGKKANKQLSCQKGNDEAKLITMHWFTDMIQLKLSYRIEKEINYWKNMWWDFYI